MTATTIRIFGGRFRPSSSEIICLAAVPAGVGMYCFLRHFGLVHSGDSVFTLFLIGGLVFASHADSNESPWRSNSRDTWACTSGLLIGTSFGVLVAEYIELGLQEGRGEFFLLGRALVFGAIIIALTLVARRVHAASSRDSDASDTSHQQVDTLQEDVYRSLVIRRMRLPLALAIMVAALFFAPVSMLTPLFIAAWIIGVYRLRFIPTRG